LFHRVFSPIRIIMKSKQQILDDACSASLLVKNLLTPGQYFTEDERQIIYSAMEAFEEELYQSFLEASSGDLKDVRRFESLMVRLEPKDCTVGNFSHHLALSYSKKNGVRVRAQNRAFLRILEKRSQSIRAGAEDPGCALREYNIGRADGFREAAELGRSLLDLNKKP